jgi:hypothetical protein
MQLKVVVKISAAIVSNFKIIFAHYGPTSRFRIGMVKILILVCLTFILFIFLFLGVRFQVSVFSEASGRRDDQIDQKTDSSVVELDTRICDGV